MGTRAFVGGIRSCQWSSLRSPDLEAADTDEAGAVAVRAELSWPPPPTRRGGHPLAEQPSLQVKGGKRIAGAAETAQARGEERDDRGPGPDSEATTTDEEAAAAADEDSESGVLRWMDSEEDPES